MGPAASEPWADEDVWADLYEPSLGWAARYKPGLVDADESTATIHGIDGDVVVVRDLDQEPSPVVPAKPLSWARAVRHRFVLGWIGGVLLALAAVGVLAATAWDSPTEAGLSAAYGFVGMVILSSSIRR